MKLVALIASALFFFAQSAYPQNDTLPELAAREMLVLAGGSTCNTEVDCFFQYRLRLAGLRPGRVGPDVALLLSTVTLLDFSLAHSGRLSDGLYLSPRLGISIGSFQAVALNVGAGLIAVPRKWLAVRLDATYRGLWIGEFGVETSFGLGSLTLGVGMITGPRHSSGG